MTAQSPRAHTPGYPATSIYSFTSTLPLLSAQASAATTGWGDVPAAQMVVQVSTVLPSSVLTLSFVTPAIRVLSRNSIPRF
jgi:hypothetical protein